MHPAAHGERLIMYHSLSEAIGSNRQIADMNRVSGGDINQAFRLTLTDGSRLFLKANTKDNLPFFTAETEGLSAIAGTGAVRTPSVLGIGTDDVYGAFLLLEWVDARPRSKNYWENFGHALAAMHKADTSAILKDAGFGFCHDNYIGAGRQINTPAEGWIEFFRDRRLSPMLRRAEAYMDILDKRHATYEREE